MKVGDAVLLVLRLANEAMGLRPPQDRTPEQLQSCRDAIDMVHDIVLSHYEPSTPGLHDDMQT